MIRKLPTSYVPKVWGVERLPAPFTHSRKEKIGEIWFEPPAELDQLLIKYIFTSEPLSVQCHPDDAQAQRMGHGTGGKNEGWIIIDAAPDARIAVGFREEISTGQLKSAVSDGSIMEHLAWHEVKAGDVFYIPAGTVHAIGGGVGLIEVQQNSDVTFRLFDYGRPRELHLEKGLEVACTTPFNNEHKKHIYASGELLLNSPSFRAKKWTARTSSPQAPQIDGPAILILYAGKCVIDGESVLPGECVLCTSIESFSASADTVILIAEQRPSD